MKPSTKPIVIIGTGLAGYNLAKELRKIDTNTPLVLVTQDDGHFYSKPQLSTAFFYGKNPKELIITDVNTMQTQLDATIYTHTSVCDIDSKMQKISLDSPSGQHEIEYRDLVLALGASPKPFPLLAQHPRNYRINNRLDFAHFEEQLAHIEHLCIIGSGLVGCEFAHDFVKKVKQISLITIDPQPLHNLVPEQVGKALQRALENSGITFYTNARIESISSSAEKVALTLNSQDNLIADAVLTAIGLAPNCDLAKKAGIQTSEGIVVDSSLKTNQPHIYALGDCAQINGICRQYVAPILQSARALAQTLTTQIPCAVSFPPTPISLKVQTYPVIVMPPSQKGQWQFESDGEGIKALFMDDEGNLKGYALGGKAVEQRQECLKSFMQAQQNVCLTA